MRQPTPEQILHMRDNCVATNLRRATRFVNRIYEEEFRGYEITAVQFAIFAVLGMHGEMSGSIPPVSRSSTPQSPWSVTVWVRRGV